MHLSKISLALRQWGAAGFSPLSLFASGEQGAWFDPSDLSTMFQDSAGTTPVTADGQPVGLILDKSQSLALGPELVVNGDFASGTSAGWTMSFNASGSSVINEEFNLVISGGSGGFYQDIPVVMGQYYELSALMRKVSGSNGVRIQVYDGASFTNLIAQYGFVTTVGSAIKYMFRLRTALSSVLRIYLTGQDGATGGYDNVSVKLLSGNHASQATAAARPLYKTDGTYHWLQFDGVDDSLSTAAIDFTVTDSMSVFAGFYKASDAGTGILVELSSNSNTNNGVFALIGPSASGGSDLLYRSKGTVNSSTTITSVLSSVKYVSANMSKISTDLFEMRLNGVSRQSLATDQGSGNYGNYIMYIGMRGSASAAFIGNLYPLIIRGALSDAQQITDVETWINRKTGAY